MADTDWTQTAGMTSDTDTDNVTDDITPTDTSYTQRSGMTSETDVDNLESYSEQAEASKDAAAASAAAAAASEAASAASETAAETAEANAETAEANAAASAATATTKASEASVSAAASAASEGTSTTQAGISTTQATAAAASATAAAASETAAAASESAAETAKDAALAALDNFDDRYLGQKASDPTVDNDGDALVAGALYFNTTDDTMRVYEGSTWVAAYASLSGALLASQNLSDLTNAATARSNLGLGTAATTASTDYATAAQGSTADSAVQPNDSPTFGSVTVTGTVDGRDVAADGTKLDGIEAGADVTDTANVTAAGALMDSEVTNLAQVKAFDGSDYATAAQGALADSAIQSGDLSTVATTGAYSDLTGKPTLGTAAATASTDYATAAQGTLADSAVQPNDSPTFGTVTATSFSGDGSALTGLPAGYTDADVDTHLNYSTATTGQVLSYSGSDYDWIDAASGAGAGGGGSDEIFWENGQNVTTNYTITDGKNAMSAGPITIDTGITVTVGSGETWTVV